MKSLLAHGEKVFLLIVLAIAGYSLVSSAITFQRGTALAPNMEEKFLAIEKAYEENRPPDPRKLTYAAHLRATVRSGTDKIGPRIDPWIAHWPPRPDEDIQYKPGALGVPVGLKADGQRDRVDVSWLEPSLEYVGVVAYQVFKWRTGEDAPTEPTFPEETGTSLVDGDVEAEEVYSYKVRAIGVAKPQQANDVIDQPPGTTEIDFQGRKAWVTECSAQATATTPSNVDFVFYDTYDDFGTMRARMTVKVWEEGGWLEYEVEGGAAADGKEIVGYRQVGFQKKEYKSGYVLQKIGEAPHTYDTGKTRWVVIVRDDGTRDRVEEKILRDVIYKFIVVQSTETGRPVTVIRKSDVEKYPTIAGGASPAPVAKAPPREGKRPKEKDTDEVDFGGLRAKATGAGDVNVAAGGGAGARSGAGNAPPANPIDKWDTYLNSQQSSLTFNVPGNWDKVAAAFTYGETANATLTKDFVVAYAGPMDNMMVVQQVFVEEGPHGDATDELVRGYAEDWKKETLAAFPAAEVESDVSVVPGFEGRLLGFFVATAKVDDKDLTIARYCGYTTKFKRMFTFICSTPDYDALNRTYMKILATINW